MTNVASRRQESFFIRILQGIVDEEVRAEIKTQKEVRKQMLEIFKECNEPVSVPEIVPAKKTLLSSG